MHWATINANSMLSWVFVLAALSLPLPRVSVSAEPSSAAASAPLSEAALSRLLTLAALPDACIPAGASCSLAAEVARSVRISTSSDGHLHLDAAAGIAANGRSLDDLLTAMTQLAVSQARSIKALQSQAVVLEARMAAMACPAGLVQGTPRFACDNLGCAVKAECN
eukprot:m.254129 g.254129  ORF g.254129 m.254129 type:complete len:166 (-) comp18792_c0_seq1:314-811(-)